LRKAVVLVLLLWILFLLSLIAWELGYGQNTAPPQSPERFAKVRAMILEALQKSGAPSISIAVAENGKVVWEDSFGYADKEKKIQATPDSTYALASISKSFTATGLMVLAEKKLVDLDKPANEYLEHLRCFRGGTSPFPGRIDPPLWDRRQRTGPRVYVLEFRLRRS